MKKLVSVLICLLVLVPVFGQSFNVLTVNAWSGLTHRGFFSAGRYEPSDVLAFRNNTFLTRISELSPDILTVNEANPLPGYSAWLAEALEMDAVYQTGYSGPGIKNIRLPAGLREGEVILAKENLGLEFAGRRQLRGGSVSNNFSLNFSKTSQIVGTTLEIEGRTVYVFTAHWSESPFANQEYLDSILDQYLEGDLERKEALSTLEKAMKGREQRLKEAEKSLSFINELAGESPVILTGTLAALPDSPELKILTNAGFKDVWQGIGSPGYTWDPQENGNIEEYYGQKDGKPFSHVFGSKPRRVDYILYRGSGLRLSSTRVVLQEDTYGVYPSDHYGVSASFSLIGR